MTAADLAELEGLLVKCGGTATEIEAAKSDANGLGLFVRSLVGLDREAAKRAFAGFVAGAPLTANQIEFVNMVIDHLTEHGAMPAGLLYESPFTDIAPSGPDGIVNAGQIEQMVGILLGVEAAATAA